MPTHLFNCVVCGTETGCCADEHVLGAGIPGGCRDDNPIEFCSLDCFMALRDSMEERLRVAKELHPEWFVEAT